MERCPSFEPWYDQRTGKTGAQVSRLLKRLHAHGLIRKVGRTCKYYRTKFGQEVVLAGLKLRELVVIPSLAGVSLG